ncbi:MAG: peptidoglycan recognition family protein [Bacilli bacterium]|nr:peptidoglycan recognition family protein [Bacilli bacterium]
MSQKYSNYKHSNNEIAIEEKLITYGMNNRSGLKQIPRYIVIHEVSLGIGRSPETYNMDYYAKKIQSDGENGITIGYHFLVGDKCIYQFLKEDEATHHCGTFEGNNNSIGIERLICQGIDYEQALHNQAKLIATLMVKWNIPIENVVTHKKIQQLFTPNVIKYDLKIDFKSEKQVDNLSLYYDEILLNVKNLVLTNYALLINNLSDDEKNNLYAIIKRLYRLKNTAMFLIKQSKFEQVSALYEMVKLKTEFDRILCTLQNKPYNPQLFSYGSIKFKEKIVAKNCPNRLLVGQRGGLSKFYREIQKCLKHEWLFENLLDNSVSKQKKL